MGLKSLLWLIVFLVACLWVPSSLAIANPEAKSSPGTDLSQDEENIRYFTDLKVQTHEGEELRFYSDILKDKLVVISFFYTNCPTAQPTLATFFRLQKRLGNRLSRDIVLLTISVDPEKDTPDAIKEYARKFNPQKGWLFLTGKSKNLEVINRRLGNNGRLPEGHQRLFLIGNLRTGHWMKMVETAPEIALAQGLHSLTLED